MKTLTKTVLAVLAIGCLVWGAEGVALADHNNPDLAQTGQPGYAPDYNYPMNTSQAGWTHNTASGGGVGYPPDYSNVPTWLPKGSADTGVSAQPQASQAQPAVPVAP